MGNADAYAAATQGKEVRQNLLLCPCRLHRGDVVARMVTELINSGQVDVVCACFQGLHQMGHDRALAHVSLTIAKMGRPDIIAAVSHHACFGNRIIMPGLAKTANNESRHAWLGC